MRCCRKILNISWKDKIRNEEVLPRISSCKFRSKRILARITESQLTWFGHVCRMNNMCHPKWTLMETVPGKAEGRPRTRWEYMLSWTQAPIFTRHIGMHRIEKQGLNLFVEPTSSGTQCRDIEIDRLC